MKKTSKIFSVVLALVLVFAMAIPAFAAGNGTITITNAVDGADYNIYKMFDFAPIGDSADKGFYTVVAGWEAFIAEGGDGAAYLKVDTDNGTIVWNGAETDERKAELAKLAVAYAKENDIDATATAPASGTTVEFTGLDLGYYAIDTSLGTLCALTNTNSDFTATEKNAKPTIDKFVQEDSEMNNDDEGWGKVNDADIDQVVNYKSTITVGLGATNYVMHDTMEAGLTFDADSVVVKLADGTVVDAANYTVTVSPTDGHTFDVAFNNDFIAGLAKGSTFTVYYSATLNEAANIVVDGNDNTVYLSYGEDSTWETEEHKTTTYTWKFDVFKHNSENTGLAGAKFELRLTEDGDPIKFTKDGNTYKVDADGTVTEIETDDTGAFEFVGLDEGTYFLVETQAPANYNELEEPIEVVITSEYDEGALEATYKVNGNDPATINVLNQTGGLLPETGGIGTTIFYVVGLVLVLGAAVLLITKKRMTCEA